MNLTKTHGIDMNSWYRIRLVVDMDSWCRHGLINKTWTHGIDMDSWCLMVPSVTGMRDFFFN